MMLSAGHMLYNIVKFVRNTKCHKTVFAIAINFNLYINLKETVCM